MAASTLLVAGCGGLRADSTTPDSKATADSEVTADGEAHVVVRVRAAERISVGRTVSALGRCEALPDKLALLTPAVEGQVESVFVTQGQHVTARQALVQFDLTLAKADLAEKQAARDSLRASLALLESRPRTAEQQASKLAIEQAKIAVARASALVERLRPLRASKEIPEQQLYEVEQSLKQAQVQQQSAEAQLEAMMLVPRPEAVAEAQSKIKVAEEAVKLSQARLELHTIRAPIEGVIDSLTCRLGQTIAIGTTIGEVIDNRQILGAAWLPVSRSQVVRVGQTAQIQVATPQSATTSADDALKTIAGRIIFVGRIADAQTGNMPVQVLADNSRGDLVVGQTLNMAILVEQPTPRLAVPVAAIHDEGQGSVITVVRDGKAVLLHPQLGATQSDWIAVSDTDLKEGEPVIVEGGYNLPEGTAVTTETASP